MALVKQAGEYFLSLQRCYVDDGQVKFGNQARFRLDDGTAGVALQLAQDMLYGMLQGQLSGDSDGPA